MSEDKYTRIGFRASNPETIKQLEQIHKNKSVGINRACEAYVNLRKYIQHDLKGKFTRDEIGYLADIQNATMFQPEFACRPDMWVANIEDAAQFDGTDEKWGVKLEDLVTKVRGLSPSESFFMQEEIDRFWNTPQAYGHMNANLERFMMVWSKESGN